MFLSLRRKLTIISLVLYWAAVFILAHIPIPEMVYRARLSDKGLHVAVYLILVFLLWFSISPDRKVSLRRGTVWWVFLAVAIYGMLDEVLQGHTGRSCDMGDLLADIGGAIWGLALFSFLTFWPALLAVTGITIFLLTNLAKANIAELAPMANTLFHLVGYGVFALVWMRNLQLWFSVRTATIKWLSAASAGPIAFLLLVKLFSLPFGKAITAGDLILAVIGIAAAVVMVFAAESFKKRRWTSG